MPRLTVPPLLVVAALALAVAGCGGSTVPDFQATAAPAHAPGEFGRNVVRIPGESGTDVAAAAALALYPPGHAHPPRGWVLVRAGDWRTGLLAAQFAAHPVDAALLPIDSGFLPAAAQDVMSRLGQSGFPRTHGLQVILLGSFGQPVIRSLKALGLKVAELDAPSAAQLSLALVPYRGGFAGGYAGNVLVVSSQAQARAFALAAGAWSAYTGDTIAFVNPDGVPAATARLLAQRRRLLGRPPAIYVIGPRSVIAPNLARRLARFGTVRRVDGTTPSEVALSLARESDPATGFGWGLGRGPASVTLMDPAQGDGALGAFAFAAAGPQAPLLLTEGPRALADPVARYLALLGRRAPSQAFVIGSGASIGSALLRQVDGTLGAGSR